MFPKMFAVAVLFLSICFKPAFAAQAVDINTADAATIAENLNGIGESKARAIVAYRAEHGNFLKEQDLIKVKGIGAKLIERNRDLILFGKNAKAAKPIGTDKKKPALSSAGASADGSAASSKLPSTTTDTQPQLSN